MIKNYPPGCLTTNSFPKILSLLALAFFVSYSSTLFSQSNLSKNTNKEVVQKYLDTFNKHDLSEINKLFATVYIWHTLDGREIHSLQDSSHIATLRSVLRAIPNIHYTIESIISEGDMVAVNSTVTGAVQSPSGQKKLQFKQMFFFRLSGGLIKEEWEVLDTDLMMKQMGRNCPD